MSILFNTHFNNKYAVSKSLKYETVKPLNLCYE